jgi:hypothetical protein
LWLNDCAPVAKDKEINLVKQLLEENKVCVEELSVSLIDRGRIQSK